jgi:hypothetical protein
MGWFGKDYTSLTSMAYESIATSVIDVGRAVGMSKYPREAIEIHLCFDYDAFKVMYKEIFDRWYISDEHDHYLGTRGNVTSLQVYYKSEAGAKRVLARVLKERDKAKKNNGS